MRTLQLEEYGPPVDAALTAGEVTAILGLRPALVKISPTRTPETYSLRAENVVGAVVMPMLRLLVRPKIRLQNLFFLLVYGQGITEWRPERFPFHQDDDLLSAVGWVFEAEVRAASTRGLARGYRLREESLPTLRARIDFARQVRFQQGRSFPLECRYEEYGEDVELNRMLKAAHRRLLQLPSLDADLARRLHRTWSFFSGATDVSYPPHAVPSLRFDRLTRHWEAAGRLAELILRADAIRDQEGNVVGSSFTVDMNVLFENFVTAVVAREAARGGWILERHAPRRLSPRVAMVPDLVLRRGAGDYAVGDAKYKALARGEPPNADLYQLLAYCVALGLRRGLLIYGEVHPLERHVVERAGVSLELEGVDLSGRPEEILLSARQIAGRLVDQARERRAMERGAA